MSDLLVNGLLALGLAAFFGLVFYLVFLKKGLSHERRAELLGFRLRKNLRGGL